jgi:vitamin B12 transporter
MPMSLLLAQNKSDSSKMLENVTVVAEKKTNPYSSVVPVQSLDHETLNQINAESAGDAAKYFSGVFIKDYGGVGGLKTISVRSLGGLNTGIMYDGITVADAQTGQVDLSKFSATFIQRMDLFQSNPPQSLLPARAYASASILTISSNTFSTPTYTHNLWQAGLNAGSFGLWQPSAGFYFPAGKNIVVSANAEAVWSKGNYPFHIDNGMFSQFTNRINSDVKSFQGELNLAKKFADSSQLNVKLWYYRSERGLPGSIIYFNNISVQRLNEQDLFIQSQYRKKIAIGTTLLFSFKYSSYETRYLDPNFPNGTGGLDDQYKQNEFYFSAGIAQQAGKYFTLSLASDLAKTSLVANIKSFPAPIRISLWNNFAVQFAKSHWVVNASLLNTYIEDKAKNGASAGSKNKFTPSIALSYKTTPESPFMFRVFYKDIFRMPTFNDQYYTYNPTVIPKLQPEYSSQYDAGIGYSKNLSGAVQQFSFSVDGYYNYVRDKIVAVPSQNLFVWTVVNLGVVEIKGLDMNVNVTGKISTSSRWSARLAYTWQQALDMTDPSGGEYKNTIPYTPSSSGSGLTTFYYKNWSASYSLLLSGVRYALVPNDPSNEMIAWAQQDLTITKHISFQYFQTTIKGEISNIFNKQYEVVQYYPMPGRAFKLSIIFNNL